MSELVPTFARLHPDVVTLLRETLDDMNKSRRPGDPRMMLGDLIGQCVMIALAPNETVGPVGVKR
jgi:hypothetical protein